jgi:hypothetical protein
MSRRSPGYYAFRCHTREPGLRRLAVVGGRVRVDGQLLRFPSYAARATWIADAGEEVREVCTTRALPAGWRVEEALDVPVKAFAGDADIWDAPGDGEGE